MQQSARASNMFSDNSRNGHPAAPTTDDMTHLRPRYPANCSSGSPSADRLAIATFISRSSSAYVSHSRSWVSTFTSPPSSTDSSGIRP